MSYVKIFITGDDKTYLQDVVSAQHDPNYGIVVHGDDNLKPEQMAKIETFANHLLERRTDSKSNLPMNEPSFVLLKCAGPDEDFLLFQEGFLNKNTKGEPYPTLEHALFHCYQHYGMEDCVPSDVKNIARIPYITPSLGALPVDVAVEIVKMLRLLVLSPARLNTIAHGMNAPNDQNEIFAIVPWNGRKIKLTPTTTAGDLSKQFDIQAGTENSERFWRFYGSVAPDTPLCAL